MPDGPRHVDLRDRSLQDVDLGPVVAHLRAGGLLGYPTETVYGFGGRCSADAVGRLAALKGRDPARPFLLLIAGAEAVPRLAWSEGARMLAAALWPGPLTLVLADPEGTFPVGIRSPAGTVAVRQSPHPLAARLVQRLGEPVTSTSANRAGERPATDGAEALAVAVGLGAGPDTWVLDVGRLPPSPASTIVDCSGRVPRIVRAGAVPAHRLRDALPEIDDI